MNTGDVYDRSVFRKPESLLDRPKAQGALYLDNSRIQYIHAMCLSRPGGEHERISAKAGAYDVSIDSTGVNWPDGFLALCEEESTGQIRADLQSMKVEAGEDPNHVFPLRDVESQFKLQVRQGPDRRPIGSLSHAQLLREAYPGAVYYYATTPFRVYKVLMPSHEVLVRPEKRYTTTPQHLPTLVYPNLTTASMYHAATHGNLNLIECDLQIREAICGFKERRGPNEFPCNYPTDVAKSGVSFPLPLFTRNYFTTGCVFSHPCLDTVGVNLDVVAALVFEAFLIEVPFDRNDINVGRDKHRVSAAGTTAGSHFVAIYDQTYGSLRLTSKLTNAEVLGAVCSRAVDLAQDFGEEPVPQETNDALELLAAEAAKEPAIMGVGSGYEEPPDSDVSVRVILPGSVGLNCFHNNEEFEITGVFFSPKSGLMYRGKRASNPSADAIDLVPVAAVVEIPGESKMGYYDLETGEVKEGWDWRG